MTILVSYERKLFITLGTDQAANGVTCYQKKTLNFCLLSLPTLIQLV